VADAVAAELVVVVVDGADLSVLPAQPTSVTDSRATAPSAVIFM